MRYQQLNPDLFRLNRRRFAQKMQPDSIAIFHSNELMPRNGDTYYPFRQNSSLFYLCGIDQPETVLVLFPDCVREGYHELVFTKKQTEKGLIWDGPLLSKEEVQQTSGIQKVFWLEDMEVLLHDLILLAKRIYINLNEYDRFKPDLPSKDHRFAQQLMQQYPAHKYHRAQPILKKLMMIKSSYEIKAIQQAINITEQAFRRTLEFVKPGVKEYEVEAEITHEFIRSGANGHAYEPIVASGNNSNILHYIKNNQTCKDGDLLLMDFGAEYANYAADLSRTIPVSGQFTARQRAVYEAVLRVLKAAQQLLVPGTILEEHAKEVGALMEKELLDLKLITAEDIENQNPEQPAYKTYFMHGVSHHLGLAVHDLSNRYVPVQAGMVFTCEPAIYIPEEGFGIRLENNILVTDEGPINLMENIPIEVEEIEALMRVEVLQ